MLDCTSHKPCPAGCGLGYGVFVAAACFCTRIALHRSFFRVFCGFYTLTPHQVLFLYKMRLDDSTEIVNSQVMCSRREKIFQKGAFPDISLKGVHFILTCSTSDISLFNNSNFNKIKAENFWGWFSSSCWYYQTSLS